MTTRTKTPKKEPKEGEDATIVGTPTLRTTRAAANKAFAPRATRTPTKADKDRKKQEDDALKRSAQKKTVKLRSDKTDKGDTDNDKSEAEKQSEDERLAKNGEGKDTEKVKIDDTSSESEEKEDGKEEEAQNGDENPGKEKDKTGDLLPNGHAVNGKKDAEPTNGVPHEETQTEKKVAEEVSANHTETNKEEESKDRDATVPDKKEENNVHSHTSEEEEENQEVETKETEKHITFSSTVVTIPRITDEELERRKKREEHIQRQHKLLWDEELKRRQVSFLSLSLSLSAFGNTLCPTPLLPAHTINLRAPGT